MQPLRSARSLRLALARATAALAACAMAATLLAACGGADDERPAGESPLEGKADGPGIRFQVLSGLFVPTVRVQAPLRRVFRTAEELRATLGIDPPAGLDFSRQWAIFYTPGTATPELQTVPGYRASFIGLRTSTTGRTLYVTTRLELPGNCPRRSTRPFVLAAFTPPSPAPEFFRFSSADRTLSCDGELTYYDGVGFTEAQAAAALTVVNSAAAETLQAAGITGMQLRLLLEGRPWPSLSLVSATAGIGPATMEKLRALASAPR